MKEKRTLPCLYRLAKVPTHIMVLLVRSSMGHGRLRAAVDHDWGGQSIEATRKDRAGHQ